LAVPQLELRNQVAVVTGGSRGIGRAVVEILARLGAGVVVNYMNDQQAAERVVAAATKVGVNAIAVKANVANSNEAESLIKQAIESFGRLDILICNAGIWRGAPAEDIDEALWDETMEINLKGTWLACRSAIPFMKKQRSGRIVIVSSTAGQRGEANVSNYAASKGAQISFAKSLSTELAPFGITVNCVAPGWVDTDLNDEVFKDKARMASIVETIPLGRVASPEDIALPIAFLCTEAARHITGEVLNVNGGSVLCG